MTIAWLPRLQHNYNMTTGYNMTAAPAWHDLYTSTTDSLNYRQSLSVATPSFLYSPPHPSNHRRDSDINNYTGIKVSRFNCSNLFEINATKLGAVLTHSDVTFLCFYVSFGLHWRIYLWFVFLQVGCFINKVRMGEMIRRAFERERGERGRKGERGDFSINASRSAERSQVRG